MRFTLAMGTQREQPQSTTRAIRVVQAAWGGFTHPVALARHLDGRAMLEAIFTTYPWWMMKKEGLERGRVHCRWRMTVVYKGLLHYGVGLGPLERPWLRATARDYTRWLARHLPACDVLIAMSGLGQAAGKLAQERGARYICDRSSSHIRYADNLLREEFGRWRIPYAGDDPVNVDAEEREYQQADLITVPSGFALRSFVTMGVAAEKLRRASQGVDLSRFHKVADPPPEEFRVLFVGQLCLRKGVPYLLEAFRRLRHPRKRLLLAGRTMPDFKQWMAGRPTEHATFLGHVPKSELPRCMSTSHVHVFPSIEDGFGIVQAEALACGCPLISSANTGAADLFTHGQEGFVVPIRDAQAITDRLEELAQNPQLRQRMSEAALRRVAALGGWDTYCATVETIIRQLVEACPTPPAPAPQDANASWTGQSWRS